MAISFYRLLELAQSTALLDSGQESKAVEAVRSGLNFKNSNFWDDFINLCGNSESLSELLDVPTEKIARWPSSIRNALEKIEKSDDSEAGDKKEMIPTDQPPLADPNGMNSNPNNSDIGPTP